MVFLGDLEDTPIMKVTMCGSWGQTIRGQPQKVPAVFILRRRQGKRCRLWWLPNKHGFLVIHVPLSKLSNKDFSECRGDHVQRMPYSNTMTYYKHISSSFLNVTTAIYCLTVSYQVSCHLHLPESLAFLLSMADSWHSLLSWGCGRPSPDLSKFVVFCLQTARVA